MNIKNIIEEATRLGNLIENLKQQLAEKDKEIERLKEKLDEVHALSYPGLAVKESILLNKIYKLTMVYASKGKESKDTAEQALKGEEE